MIRYSLALTGMLIALATPANAEKKPRAVVDLTPTSPADILPDGFRGSITYRGIYKGKASAPSQMTSGWARKLEASIGVKMFPAAGDFAIMIEFTGGRISGSTQTTSGLQGEHANLEPGHFIGMRNGVVCHLQWSDGSETTDYCGRSEYRSRIDNTAENGQKSDLTIDAPANEVVDFAAREQPPGNLATHSTSDAHYAAGSMNSQHVGTLKTDSAGNIVATTAATGMSLQALMDLFVHADSRSWTANHYDVGSMKNAKYITTNKAHTTYVAYGEYSYTGFFGGGSGWVKVKVDNGNLSCFEFWDQPGNCRAPWASLSQQNVAGIAGAMMTSGSGFSSTGSSDNPEVDEDVRRNIQRQADNSQVQSAPGWTAPTPAQAPELPHGCAPLTPC